MTPPERDYDELLSRVLRSTTERIEPAGDGLAKIRDRLAEPWLKRRLSLLRAEVTALGWLIAVRCEPLISGVRSRLAARGGTAGAVRWRRLVPPALRTGAAHPAAHRRGDPASRSGLDDLVHLAETQAAAGWHDDPAGRRGRGMARWPRAGPAMTRLRPVLAVVAAVVIIVAGVFALEQAPPFVGSPASNSTRARPGTSGHGRGRAAGHRHGHNQAPRSPHAVPGSTARPRKAAGTYPALERSSPPSARVSPTPAPSPPASPTPSPTPSPTVTPTASPSPTATDSDGTLQSGGGNATGG